MTPRNTQITADELRRRLDYDPATGVFTWVTLPVRNGHLVGKPAGRKLLGYIRIKINGVAYAAHRLAWLHVTGSWPTKDIDHRDGDRSNNRWENLREANASENAFNRTVPSSNTSGFKGVTWNKNCRKWQASIETGGRAHYLGLHETAEAAKEAYDAKLRELAGDFARSA